MLGVLGKTNSNDGVLPSLSDIRFHIRASESESELESELDLLVEKVDTIERHGKTWKIRNWFEMQVSRSTRYELEAEKKKQVKPKKKISPKPVRNKSESDSESDATIEEEVEEEVEGDSEEENKDIGAAPVEIQEEEPEEITSNHPCIKAWQDVMHRFPPKNQWSLIVRDSMGDRKTVTRALQTWKSKGWNPTNYDAICERMRYIRAKDIDALVEQEKRMYEQQNEFGKLTGLA